MTIYASIVTNIFHKSQDGKLHGVFVAKLEWENKYHILEGKVVDAAEPISAETDSIQQVLEGILEMKLDRLESVVIKHRTI